MSYEDFKKQALKEIPKQITTTKSYEEFKNKALGITPTKSESKQLPFTDSNNILNPLALTRAVKSAYVSNQEPTQKADELIGEEARKRMEFMLANGENALEKATENDIKAFQALTGKSEEETRQYIIDNLGNRNKYNYKNFRANYTMGDLQTDLNKAYYDYIQNPTKEKQSKIDKLETQISNYATYASNYGKGGLITNDYASYLPQQVEQTGRGILGAITLGATSAGVGGAIGSVVPVGGTAVGALAGLKAGVTAGYIGGVSEYSYEQMQGGAYRELKSLGVPNDIAIKVSKDTAIKQALIEGAEAGVDLATIGFGFIKNLFSKQGTKTVAELTLKQKIKKALIAYGINLATETAEEASQEYVAIQGEKKALKESGIERNTTAKEDIQRIVEAGAGGFKIALVAGSSNVIGSVLVNSLDSTQARNLVNKKYDDYISKIANDNSLSQEQKNSMIQEAEKGRAETIFAMREVGREERQNVIKGNYEIVEEQNTTQSNKTTPSTQQNRIYDESYFLPADESNEDEQNISNAVKELTYNNEDITEEMLENKVNEIISKEFEGIDIEEDDTAYDRFYERLNELRLQLEVQIVSNGYEYDKSTNEFVPTQQRLSDNIDDLNIKYGDRASTTLQNAQFEKIRNNIQEIISDKQKDLPDNISITSAESKTSPDATYISIINEDTGKEYIIRVGNHFKEGVSGSADSHISISDYKTIPELMNKIEQETNNGLSNLNVDITQDKRYNNQYATVAPYRLHPVTENTYEESRSAVEKGFLNKANLLANQLGIKINNVSNNMGGFVSQQGEYKGKFVNEVSYTFELGDATKEQADLFASILGDTGFETQESVISSTYAEENNPNANATEVRLSVNSIEGVADALDKVGIKNYTIDRTNKVIRLITDADFSDITEVDVANLMEELGGNLNGTEHSKIESRYLDGETRRGMYETWLATTEESDKNRELRNNISKALESATREVERQKQLENENSKKGSFSLPENEGVYKSFSSKSNNPIFTSSSYLTKEVQKGITNSLSEVKQNKELYNSIKSGLDEIIKKGSNRAELLMKLGALTDEKITSIARELGEETIDFDKNLNPISLKKYLKDNGDITWGSISRQIRKSLKEIRNDFSEKINTVKEGKIIGEAITEARNLMKSLGYKDEKINRFLDGYANEYDRNLYSNILDAFIYYSRPLEEIEKTNFSDTKKTNYLIEKRRWDYLHSTEQQGNTTQGVSFADMRRRIEKYLGKDIMLKGFRERAYGIYRPSIDEIRTKNISDIDTAIHELGHRIDFKELQRASNKIDDMDSELGELCVRAFGDHYLENIEATLSEGFAEFVRRFVCDNENTIKEYPITSEFFVKQMNQNKNLQSVVTDLINMVESYVYSNSETMASGMMSVGEATDESMKSLTTKQKLQEKYDEFMTRWFDDMWEAKKLTAIFAKNANTNVYEFNPSQNVYNLLRLNKANESKTIDIAKHGFYDEAGNKATKGLGEILEPFENDSKKMMQIRNLLYARRTLDYMAKNLESGLGVTDAINIITNTTDRDIINAVRDIEEFADYPFKMALAHGMISKEDYIEVKKWNRFYVPLKRVFDEQVNRSTGGKKNSGNLIRKRTGSLRDVIDPLESIIQNITFMLDKIAQNDVMKVLESHALDGVSDFYSTVSLPQKLTATVNMDIFKNVLKEQLGQEFDDLDIDFEVVKNIFSPKLSDDKTMTLTYMDNGTLKAIQFHNKALYNIFSGELGKAQNFAEWLKTFDNMAGILRSGATAMNVEFAIPNMISDTFVAWVYSNNGFVPVFDTVRGVFDYAMADFDFLRDTVRKLGSNKYIEENNKLYSYYKQSGAQMSTRVGSYRTEVQDYLKEVIGKHAVDLYSADESKVKRVLKSIIEGAKKLPNGIQDVLSILPELSEQATRFEYFKKSYNKYIQKGYSHRNAQLQAGIDTKNSTIDFNRAGTWSRSINRLIAFSNASLQGTYRALEGIRRAPAKTLSRVALIAIAYLTLKSVLGDDDEELEEVSDQTKRDNYIFKIGDKIIKVKKPQDSLTRNVLNFAETLYDVAKGKTTDYNRAWVNLAEDFANSLTFLDVDFDKGITENIGSNIVPTGIEPLVESALNHDFYYGNQITPVGTETFGTQNQYNEYTSRTAVALGQTKLAKLLKISPAKIEHIVKGYGAGVAQQILDFTDRIIDKASDDIILPEKAPSEKFVLRRFVVDENKNSQSVSDVYDLYDKLNTKDKDSSLGGEPLTAEEAKLFENLKQAKSTFSIISKELKEVQSTLNMTSSEKRKRIDELKALRTDTARYYLGKDLINEKNANQIELYEYYPASSTYKYTPPKGVKVDVTYTEKDKQTYAELCRKYYNESLAKEIKTRAYKQMTEEEKQDRQKSLLTSARNKAKDETSKIVYERNHKGMS